MSPPVPISGKTGSGSWQEGTACISDAAGRLLFYTDGTTVYNKQNKPMLNGGGIDGNLSSQQSSIIVPLPRSDSLFYVFTSDVTEVYYNNKLTPLGYNYSIVNMCLDWQNPESGGLGGIIAGKKNIHLVDSGTEKLCAASDGANGYWILGHKMLSDSFVAWHLTNAGLSAAVTTSIAPLVGKVLTNGGVTGMLGQMKFNPEGTKVGVVNKFGRAKPTLDLYDFNPVTGRLSNHCQTILAEDTVAYALGLEFSPNGSKVYVTLMTRNANQVLQFKLSANCTSIEASRDTIFSKPYSFFSIQAAPDGQLYLGIKTAFKSRLDRILNPDTVRPVLRYDSSFIDLTNGFPANIFPDPPSFVAGFRYNNGICHCPQAVSVSTPMVGVEISIVPNPANEYITIVNEGKSSFTNLKLSIQDVTGRLVYSNPVSSSRIDMRARPTGLYFYQISSEARVLKYGRFSVVH